MIRDIVTYKEVIQFRQMNPLNTYGFHPILAIFKIKKWKVKVDKEDTGIIF